MSALHSCHFTFEYAACIKNFDRKVAHEIVRLMARSHFEFGIAKPYVAPPRPAPDYATRRRRAYPPIGDQLDALWKGGEAAAAMAALIAAVKAAHPKP